MKKDFKKFVLSLYKPVKVLAIIMIISMIISQILDLVKQYIIKDIIDIPSSGNFQINDLYKIIVILLVVIVLEIVFFYISNIIRTIYVLRKQTPYVAEMLFNSLNKKKHAFFTDNYTGKISTAITQITNQVTELNTLVTSSFISLLTSMVSSLVVLYTINFNIFIVATILFAGIVITRIIYFNKNYLPFVNKAETYTREYEGALNDAILNFTSLRLYGTIKNFAHRLKLKRQRINVFKNKASVKEFSYGATANVAYVITFAFLMMYAINLYGINAITLGDFIFFLNAMISIKSKTTLFSWTYIHIGETLVKIKNSYDLLYKDYNVEDDKKESINITTGDIKFDNVSFRYNQNYVFEDFNLNIRDKQKVGIIGVSGSGKTTLVNLLFKFYSPEQGRILIDGKDISKYNTNSLYESLTYVPQETILLHSSIYENIKIAKPSATAEEIYHAAKKAELHDFIESLENKYDTIVGERGIKLSGGQRQRIALARIFLRDSKIVIFDEATSSLDNNTEFKIQKNINKYFNEQTIICIAHRLSTLKDMDMSYLIEHGRHVDEGTPNEIIPKYDNREYMIEDMD